MLLFLVPKRKQKLRALKQHKQLSTELYYGYRIRKSKLVTFPDTVKQRILTLVVQ